MILHKMLYKNIGYTSSMFEVDIKFQYHNSLKIRLRKKCARRREQAIVRFSNVRITCWRKKTFIIINF